MIDLLPATPHNGPYKHMRECSLQVLFINFVLAFQALAPSGDHCFSTDQSPYHNIILMLLTNLHLPLKAASPTQQSPDILLHQMP